MLDHHYLFFLKLVKLILVHQLHVFGGALELHTLCRSFQTPHTLLISYCTMDYIWTPVKDTVLIIQYVLH